jgi:hypothetical protein
MRVRRLLGLAALCGVLASPVAPAAASAAPAVARAATPAAGAAPAPALAALRGRGFGSGFRSRSPRPYGYGRYRTRRHGGSFFRGVFVGWLLSHLFRGGLPLFPIFALAFLLFAARRRRARGSGLRLR